MVAKTAIATIDRRALVHNFSTLRQLSGQAKILSILKANAYGHGLLTIARALTDTDAIGVARLHEAIVLRDGGITKPIVLLEGCFDKEDLPLLVRYNLQTVVHCHEQLEDLTSSILEKPLVVWLKVDTGMHRLGFAPHHYQSILRQLKQCDNVAENIVLMSHLACADEPNSLHTQQQIQLFNDLSNQFVGQRSLANSAALLAWPQTHFEWVRPGVSLFGISPLAEGSLSNFSFLPVMTLTSRLIAIREQSAGDFIGYGASYQCPANTKLGVVAIGYGDGYPRHAKTGTPVLINGREVPLVGRVSMDMITVDLGIESADQIGDKVTLWGQGLPVEKIATCADTIAYELLCNITPRVYIDII